MLRLKSEFVETICQVYLEKHKPYKYQKLIQAYATRNNSQHNQEAAAAPENLPRVGALQDQAQNPGAGADLTPTSSVDGSIPAQAFVDEALTKCTLYELLNKTEGFLTLQHYFISAALMLDRDGGLPDQG